MEVKDLMEMKALEGNGFSPYEQMKLQHMQAKSHTSGIGIAGLVLGTVGTAAAVGSWIFGPMYGNAKANQAREAAIAAKELANVQIAASQRQLDQLTTLLASERSERLQGDYTISQTITDTISGQQSSALTANQMSELSAINTATNTVTAGLLTGQYSQNPQRVALYQDARPCQCPAGGCGCGCNG